MPPLPETLVPDGWVARRCVITGRVQGVWYRAWTIEQATTRALRGWVKNRRDGAVEALFAGPADRVEDMIAACRIGPAAARVAGIEVSDAGPGASIPAGFEKRREG